MHAPDAPASRAVGGRFETPAPGRSSNRLAAFVVFLISFAIYAGTSAPGLLFGDSAELQAAAAAGGIPHATGYPIFILIGHVFRLLPVDPAQAINLMTACFGAATLAMLVIVLGELGVGGGAAAIASLAYGLAFTPWRTSQRAEVYGLAATLALLGMWRVLVVRRTGSFGGILLAGFLLGLTMTGHLAFAPIVAILGLMLAWQVVRTQPGPIGKLVLLALAFVAGLTPYLYLVWADVHGSAINYYDLVRQVKNPFGHPMPDFDTPWKRLVWMLTGRNQYPPVPIPTDLKAGIVNGIEAMFVLFVFELGPLAGLLALFGLDWLWRRDRSLTAMLALAFAASVFFACLIQARAMLHIFLIPAMLLLTLAAGAGIADWLARSGARGGSAAALLGVLAALMIVPGPFFRMRAAAHPFTKWKFQVTEEDASLKASFLPSMRGFDAAERYRREVVPVVPESALVLADWSELNVFRYEQAVFGKRKDLTLQQITIETLPQRLEMWQKTHDLNKHPFVFTLLPPGLPVAPRDTISLGRGRFLYIQRVPLAHGG